MKKTKDKFKLFPFFFDQLKSKNTTPFIWKNQLYTCSIMCARVYYDVQCNTKVCWITDGAVNRMDTN